MDEKTMISAGGRPAYAQAEAELARMEMQLRQEAAEQRRQQSVRAGVVYDPRAHSDAPQAADTLQKKNDSSEIGADLAHPVSESMEGYAKISEAEQGARAAQDDEAQPTDLEMADEGDASEAMQPEQKEDAPQERIFKSAKAYSAELARKASREVHKAQKAWEQQVAPAKRMASMATVIADVLGEAQPEAALERLLVSSIATQRGVDDATARELAQARLYKAGLSQAPKDAGIPSKEQVQALAKRAAEQQSQVLREHPELSAETLHAFTGATPEFWRLLSAGFSASDAYEIAAARKQKQAGRADGDGEAAHRARVPQPLPTGSGAQPAGLSDADVERIDALVKRGIPVKFP